MITKFKNIDKKYQFFFVVNEKNNIMSRFIKLIKCVFTFGKNMDILKLKTFFIKKYT